MSSQDLLKTIGELLQSEPVTGQNAMSAKPPVVDTQDMKTSSAQQSAKSSDKPSGASTVIIPDSEEAAQTLSEPFIDLDSEEDE